MNPNGDETVVAGNPTQPLLLTAEQAATSLAICRTKVYELLRNGELESVQIGASRRIPATALAEYVQRLRDASRVPTVTSPRRSELRPERKT